MNKKENGSIGFSDSLPATCALEPSPPQASPLCWLPLSPLVGVRGHFHREGFRFNPATGSPTATLLRLHPSRRPHRGMRQ
ncbi:hypothetical protein LINGRAHAP2_LOCUS37579 [Linum grandiflorum]